DRRPEHQRGQGREGQSAQPILFQTAPRDLRGITKQEPDRPERCPLVAIFDALVRALHHTPPRSGRSAAQIRHARITAKSANATCATPAISRVALSLRASARRSVAI